MKVYKVSDSLFLVSQVVSAAKPVVVEAPVSHILVVDCSGSMGNDLPQIREQLKKKMPKLLGQNDLVSIIWFSGRGQFGTLLEAEPIQSLTDLTVVNAAIDRWLKPVGLTGFAQPLQEVSAVVERISKKYPGHVHSLFFLSDGCDNCSPSRVDVLRAVEGAAGNLAASTFVEYGYYADRPLLTSMAEKAGGTLIFSESFDKYAPTFEATLQKKVGSSKKVKVSIEGDVIGGFVYALQGTDLVTFAVDGDSVSVPEGIPEIWYLAPKAIGTPAELTIQEIAGNLGGDFDGIVDPSDFSALDATYGAMSLFSIRMKPDVVYPLLRAVGDVNFIERFSGCFGKQKYSQFMEDCRLAAFDSAQRFIKGFDPNKVPKDDAFTVLDLLRLIASDEGNRVLLDDPAFEYNRISRARVDANTLLTPEEQAEVQTITAAMAGTKNTKKVKELQDKLTAIMSRKPTPLKFVENKTDGYEIGGLTFNSERPNVSIQVRKEGWVDLSFRIPAEFQGETLGKIPEKFGTFCFRNYAIITDGIINVKKLPVKLTDSTLSKLSSLKDLPDGTITKREDGTTVLSLSALPVINRNMVKAVSAKDLFALDYQLLEAKAAQKVYNAYKKDLVGTKKSASFEALYGKDAAKWLAEQGFTDYSGFNPRVVQAESQDVYTGKELKVSLKGLSSLPSLSEVKTKMASQKLNASAMLMEPTVTEVEGYLNGESYLNAPNKAEAFEKWLDAKCRSATQKARDLMFDLAQIRFSVIVGQVWFSEFASLDENSMTIKVASGNLDCKVEMKEVQIKI